MNLEPHLDDHSGEAAHPLPVSNASENTMNLEPQLEAAIPTHSILDVGETPQIVATSTSATAASTSETSVTSASAAASSSTSATSLATNSIGLSYPSSVRNSQSQFSRLYRSPKFGYFKGMLTSAPPVYENRIRIDEIVDMIRDGVEAGDSDDSIYERCHKLVFPSDLSWDEIKQSARESQALPLYNEAELASRGKGRVKLLAGQMKHGNISRLLDIGCAEGSITSALQAHFSLSKDKVYGTDVTAPPLHQEHLQNSPLPFTFLHITPTTETIELPDEHVDLVTACMSIHHIGPIRAILKESFRVLTPGGQFLVREHDCRDAHEALALDVAHGFFGLVWKSPLEDPDYLLHYSANYYSESGLEDLFKSVGFKLFRRSPPQGKFRAYSCCYVKPTGTESDNSEHSPRHRSQNLGGRVFHELRRENVRDRRDRHRSDTTERRYSRDSSWKGRDRDNGRDRHYRRDRERDDSRFDERHRYRDNRERSSSGRNDRGDWRSDRDEPRTEESRPKRHQDIYDSDEQHHPISKPRH